MKRPKVHKSKARIIAGPKKAATVSKIRRPKEKAYGDRWTWAEMCAAVKKRDNHCCVKCGRHESELGLQVDHIIEVSRGGITAMYNLRSLCPICHANRPSHRAAKQLILSKVKKAKQLLAGGKNAKPP